MYSTDEIASIIDALRSVLPYAEAFVAAMSSTGRQQALDAILNAHAVLDKVGADRGGAAS